MQGISEKWTNSFLEKGESAEAELYGRIYDNTSVGGNYGYVFFIPTDSQYLGKIASAKKVSVRVRVIGVYESYNVSPTGKKENYDKTYSVKPDFGSTSSKNNKKDISDTDISKISDKAYTGKEVKPSVTVKDGSKTLKKGTDYTLTYKNNIGIGTATVTINGKGDYSGTKTVSYKIVPAKTALNAEKSGNNAILSWKTVKGAEKYQVYYSENGGKYKKLADVSGTSYTAKKLDLKNNSYTFKVRAYKKTGGKTFYGAYSKAVKLA